MTDSDRTVAALVSLAEQIDPARPQPIPLWAEAALRAAIEAAPGRADLRRTLIALLIRQRRLDDALAEATRDEAADPIGGLIRMAEIDLAAGRWLAATDRLTRAAMLDLTQIEALMRLFPLLGTLGRYAEILDVLDRIPPDAALSDTIWAAVADAGLQLGELGSAERAAARIVDPALADEFAHILARALASQRAGQASAPAWLAQSEGVRQAVLAALASDDYDAALFMIQQVLHDDDATVEDMIFVMRMGRRVRRGREIGRWGLQRLLAAAPGQTLTRRMLADAMMSAGAMRDSAELFLGLTGTKEAPPLVLRSLAFLRMWGALSAEELAAGTAAAAARIKSAEEIDFVRHAVDGIVALRTLPGSATPPEMSPAEQAWNQIRSRYRPPPAGRLRIALCLSGQLRNYRQGWQTTREALAEHDVTVFVSSWPNTGIGFGAHRVTDRRLPAEVRRHLAPNLSHLDLWEPSFPRAVGVMSQDSIVTPHEVQHFFGTDQVRFDDERAFEARHADKPGLLHKGNLNQAKMFFKIHDTNRMKSAFEARHRIVFDLVIRLRPDKSLLHLAPEDAQEAMQPGFCCASPTTRGVGDQFAMSGSAVSDLYSAIWPGMLAAGSPRFFPGASGKFSEPLLGEHLVATGVHLRPPLATKVTGILAGEVHLAPFVRAVTADLAAKEGLTANERGIVHACALAAAGDPDLVRDLIAALPAHERDRPEFQLGAE